MIVHLAVFEPLERVPLLALVRHVDEGDPGTLVLDDVWPPFYAPPPRPRREVVIGAVLSLTRHRALSLRWRTP